MNRLAAALFLATLSAAATIHAQNVGKPTPPPPATKPVKSALENISATKPGEVVLTFEKRDVGHPTETITESGLTFALANRLRQSTAVPRVMYFPHLYTDRDGILNAMSNEQGIPVKVTFPTTVSSVTLIMWGSTGAYALVEARDKDGNLLDSASVQTVPERKDPADPIPSFELTVKGKGIAYVLYGGARTGEFVAVEQVRYVPEVAATATAPANRP